MTFQQQLVVQLIAVAVGAVSALSGVLLSHFLESKKRKAEQRKEILQLFGRIEHTTAMLERDAESGPDNDHSLFQALERYRATLDSVKSEDELYFGLGVLKSISARLDGLRTTPATGERSGDVDEH